MEQFFPSQVNLAKALDAIEHKLWENDDLTNTQSISETQRNNLW